jgi:hypothetical protein
MYSPEDRIITYGIFGDHNKLVTQSKYFQTQRLFFVRYIKTPWNFAFQGVFDIAAVK